jgi:hypothetical protein
LKLKPRGREQKYCPYAFVRAVPHWKRGRIGADRLQPPRKLGEQGMELWREVHAEYCIDDRGGIEIFAQICAASCSQLVRTAPHQKLAVRWLSLLARLSHLAPQRGYDELENLLFNQSMLPPAAFDRALRARRCLKF